MKKSLLSFWVFGKAHAAHSTLLLLSKLWNHLRVCWLWKGFTCYTCMHTHTHAHRGLQVIRFHFCNSPYKMKHVGHCVERSQHMPAILWRLGCKYWPHSELYLPMPTAHLVTWFGHLSFISQCAHGPPFMGLFALCVTLVFLFVGLGRYLFALQVKQDLAHGRLTCNDTSAALLISHIVQCKLCPFPWILEMTQWSYS